MKLSVIKVPDPILRQRAVDVKKITPELVELAHWMLVAMKDHNGVGLAAPQIGQSVRLFVTGLSGEKDDRGDVPQTILFNPEIIKKSKLTNKMVEGCLSIPGPIGVVERPAEVSVRGLNEKGKTINISAHDLYARVLQHEIDHLNGVLFIDRLKKYRVVFYGTSSFGVPALAALINHPQFDVVAVVTESPKPAGRGHVSTKSPIQELAEAHKIRVLQPTALRLDHSDPERAKVAQESYQALVALKPDFQIVASYGKILPQSILDIAAIASLNIHPSLLPKYRGATPIQSAILHGETKTGISIMIMSAEMDAGPVLSQYQYRISPSDTAGTLLDRLAKQAAHQLIGTMLDILAEKAEYWEQNDQKATFTTKITAEQLTIDWSKSPVKIVNHIRSVSPKPGAYTVIDGQQIKILQAHLDERRNVSIDQVLIPGKKVMTLKDVQNGYPKIYDQLSTLTSSTPDTQP